jgi:gamma-glutamyltranspeptidase / glutathione hydrolase
MPNIDRDTLGWSAVSTTGVVAGGGAAAVAAGVAMLDLGGNAADAAVTTILALCVTDHGDCSIGGEVPLMIYDASRREVKALSGQGRAPRSQAAIDWYMANGIPGEGDMKMAPVPSVVDLCVTTLQRYGTATFGDVVASALALLDAGTEAWHPRLAVTLRKLVEEERAASGTRDERLQAATDRFYGRNGRSSDIADALEAFYIAKGGFLRRADLAAHVTTVEEPVVADYRGYTVCKCGPWTQGPFLCQAMRLLEGFDVRAMGHLSADCVHAAIEAIKLAMADRDAYYGDPDFVDVPLAALLSDAYTELRGPLIDMRRASMEARPGDPCAPAPLAGPGVYRPGVGGTTTCVIADRWGNVVAATPSANVHLPTLDGGATGVTFGNRLLSLNTTPGHPNCIQPGKRPRITLTPTLVLKDGKPVVAISVAGGDLQDQVTLNLLLDHIDFGMSPEEAVTAPRFATSHHENSFDPSRDRERAFVAAASLVINESVPAAVRDELARRGHKVDPRSEPIGHPVMLYVNQDTGVLSVAGDPKAGRHAAGMYRA